jgi:hypothetical protein
MDVTSRRRPAPPAAGDPLAAVDSPPAGVAGVDLDLARAWRCVTLSFLTVLLAVVWGPGPGDPYAWVVAELAVVAVVGVGAAIAATWFGYLTYRAGRGAGLVPVLIGSFLVLQALLRLVGTIARYQGWAA